MKIEHIAIWVKDIEPVKEYYQRYFGATVGQRYVNSVKGFQSYFLTFESGARLELMNMESIPECKHTPMEQHTGLIHLAMSLGSEQEVNRLTEVLRHDGYSVIDGPRRTGDGYYESVVLDPEGNRIELTV